MSFLLNQLLPQRLGGRGQYAPQGPTDYQKRPVPNPNCPLERMKRVIGNGTLAEPSRARSSEALSDPYEDAVLEQAFARRERWALDGVYARYHSLLYSVAFNVLHNAEDAQDCLHDALIRVWTKRVTYDVARGALRSFLVVCVRNQAISQQRTAARLARLSTKMDVESIGFEEPRIDDYIENRRLYAAFMSLPAEQQAPLVLSYFLGKTHVEIARELGLSLGTTKSRISLGLRRLGKVLKMKVPS
jgi:RNA polymerase sigma-70 factor, ECF subfamily